MGEGAPLFYDAPIEVVRGDGVWLEDTTGRRYLDLYNNVPCVGHANPRVAEAVARQAGTLNVHSRYLHEGVVEYVERLLEGFAFLTARVQLKLHDQFPKFSQHLLD